MNTQERPKSGQRARAAERAQRDSVIVVVVVHFVSSQLADESNEKLGQVYLNYEREVFDPGKGEPKSANRSWRMMTMLPVVAIARRVGLRIEIVGKVPG